jgi:predicted MFS family arabinose efflux permease
MSEPSAARAGKDWRTTGIVLGLGTAQTLAWASSYYLIAFVAGPQATDIGVSTSVIYAAFTAALLVAALLGPRVGRTIDLFGGREVLVVSSLLFAAGLTTLALANSAVILWLGWLVMGAGMGLGLYDSAFAALGRIYREKARGPITGITLIAGFASTIGWPLTAWGVDAFGWRPTCLGWAAAHVLLGLPLNLFALPRMLRPSAEEKAAVPATVVMDRNMWLMAFAFAAAWFVAAALAAHLPRLLELGGATAAHILIAGMVLGPAQVVARAAEAFLMSQVHPLTISRVAMLGHPAGAVLMLAGGGVMAVPFMALHGGGHGIVTIARGTVPLAVFGPQDYGYRLGLLGAPTRIAQAFAPLLFSLVLDHAGAASLYLTGGICIAASIALWLVKLPANEAAPVVGGGTSA